MRKLDLSKKSNKHCEHCKYYNQYDKSKSKGSNNFGLCSFYNDEFKYWHSCKNFIWHDKYLGELVIKYNKTNTNLCFRCHRPLTDPDSVARGFGSSCYNKYLHELIKRNKRLF